jgi:hypothetical protein
MRLTHRFALVLLIFVFALNFANLVEAQTQATTGVIEGNVTDPSGAAVSGAKVTVTNTGTGLERQTTSDSSGFYRVVLLPLGTYRVTVENPGFARLVLKGVEVTLGATARADAALKIASAGEEVTVTAQETPVETSKTETSEGLGELAVKELPSGSRNYLDYLTLTPNVHISQGPDGPQINVNGQKGTETSYMVDGAGANNQFFGEQRGGQRPVANVSLEAVKEFQVVAEGAAPEFGGSTGAFINVVTKSGSNEIHGSLFELQELGGLTSQLADGTSLNDYTREQFGGSLGGPIKKDKVFYFGTFEGTFTRYKKDNRLIHCCTIIDPATGIASFATPAQGGVPIDLNQFFASNFSDTEAGPIRHTNDLQAFLGKVDWIPNTRHTVTFRDYFARSIQDNGTFDIPTFGRTANGLEKDLSNAFISSWTWAMSGSKLNEFRFQYARESRPRSQVLPPDLPDTSIGSCTTNTGELSAPTTLGCLGDNFRFGRPFFHPSNVIDQQFQVNDNFTIVHGSHAIKFGGNTLNTKEANFFQGFARGRYTFDSVEGFMNFVNLGPGFVECADGTKGTATVGNPTCLAPPFAVEGPISLYLQFVPIGNNTLDQASNNNFNQFISGLYIQDKWQATRGLSISYGLRWDNYNQRGPAIPPSQTRIGQFLGVPGFPSNGLVPGYHKAFQPRLGIAWDPWNNGKTIIRANGGVFFGGLPALIIANGTANNGSIAGTIFAASFLTPFGFGPPAYPNCATGTFAPPSCPTIPNFQPFDPGVVLFGTPFVYPRAYEASIWVEREVASVWKISGGFNYALGTHQNRNQFLDPPFPAGTGPDGRPLYSGGGPFSGCSPTLPPGLPASATNPGCLGQGIQTFSGYIASDGRSLYRGATFKVDRQFRGRFQISGYYTYSQTYDDGTTERDQFTFQFSDPHNLAPERGPAAQDQRHTFGLYGLWNLPGRVTWTNTMNAHSARPRSLLCNFDANGDSVADADRVFTDGAGNYSCGPGGAGRIIDLGDGNRATLVGSLTNGHDTGRNAFRFNDPGFQWNMHVQRPWVFGDRYSLIPSVDIFNITNNANLLYPSCSELQTCLQGTLLSIPGDSRRMQFGARFEW